MADSRVNQLEFRPGYFIPYCVILEKPPKLCSFFICTMEFLTTTRTTITSIVSSNHRIAKMTKGINTWKTFRMVLSM